MISPVTGHMNDTIASGYMHPGYAESLSEFGVPRRLPLCGGWLLERAIAGSPLRDAIGCYPLFVCEDWSRLDMDLKALESELVSVSLVTDPFGQYDEGCLNQCFGDVMISFKEHYVIDLDQQMRKYVSEHHRRYARKALERVQVEKPEIPGDFIDEWVKLYETLVIKHDIRGISEFSKRAFTRQLGVPGLAMFRAVYEGSVVGILLWYVQGDIGYYHLGASNSLGYELNASFALLWHAIGFFQERGLRWLGLGAGAGVNNDGRDGLSVFKHGWATGTRTAYFCGRIFDQNKYSEITKTMGISATNYFPAYRKGEFD